MLPLVEELVESRSHIPLFFLSFTVNLMQLIMSDAGVMLRSRVGNMLMVVS